jgi:hypothetical protein
MTDNPPKITTLQPVVLPDRRRITMQMVVDNLPASGAGGSCGVNFESTMTPAPNIQLFPDNTELTDATADVTYPDIELSIVDSSRREVASLLIIEHREPVTSLTLHLRSPQPQEQYTACARMTLNNETLEVVEVPFSLGQAE